MHAPNSPSLTICENLYRSVNQNTLLMDDRKALELIRIGQLHDEET
jgi:hypothetical protein